MTQIDHDLRTEMMFGFLAVLCFAGSLAGLLVLEIRRYTRAILKAIQTGFPYREVNRFES